MFHNFVFLSWCLRCLRPTAGGGGTGRGHGNGSDLHGPEERRETPGPVLLCHHQVWVCGQMHNTSIHVIFFFNMYCLQHLTFTLCIFLDLPTEPANPFRCRLTGSPGCRPPAPYVLRCTLTLCSSSCKTHATKMKNKQTKQNIHSKYR